MTQSPCLPELPKLPPAAVDEHNLQGGRLLYSFAQIKAYGLACYEAGSAAAAQAVPEKRPSATEKDINRWRAAIQQRPEGPWEMGCGGSFDQTQIKPISDEMLAELAQWLHMGYTPWNGRSMPLSPADRQFMFMLYFSVQGLIARVRAAERIAAFTQGAEGAAPQAVVGEASDARIAGALFDFLGFLTTSEEQWKFSAYDEASPAVLALEQWAAKRGFALEPCDVSGWRAALTPSPTPTAPQEADALREAAQALVDANDAALRWGQIIPALEDLRAALAQHQPQQGEQQ